MKIIQMFETKFWKGMFPTNKFSPRQSKVHIRQIELLNMTQACIHVIDPFQTP